MTDRAPRDRDRDTVSHGSSAVSSRATPDARRLTSQERSVAELVSEGKSNREIATRLFISVTTLQFHLTHILTKLGVSSRDELRLMIDPVLLGGGKRLFVDDAKLRPLQLVDSQVTTTGAILARYVRSNADPEIEASAVPLPRPPRER